MDEQGVSVIQITTEDIREANRLSLHCPICAGPVENHPDDAALTPVVCKGCKTLYHRACWEQSGGKCAILGCDQTNYFVYGRDAKPVLTIKYADLPALPVNGRDADASRQTKRLKAEQQRQVEQLRRPSLLRRLWQWLLDQIRIGLDA